MPGPIERRGATRLGADDLRWVESGPEDAPRVLLLHGVYAGAHRYEWRRLVPELDGDLCVRSADLLGAGDSDRPDRSWDAGLLTEVVAALIDDAGGPDAHVVASSLTGAHAVHAVAADRPVRSLTLVTPTGLGRRREANRDALPGRALGATYQVLRSTPLGDGLIWALTSGPSISWFQRNKTYTDPENLTPEEVDETRRAGRATNAKHLQLAFVLDRLSVDLSRSDVESTRPLVVWADGQAFSDRAEADEWAQAGAEVVHVDSGLPQVEEPAQLAELIRGHVLGA